MEQPGPSRVLAENLQLNGHRPSGASECPEELTTYNGDILSESTYYRVLGKVNPKSDQLRSARQQQLRDLWDHIVLTPEEVAASWAKETDEAKLSRAKEKPLETTEKEERRKLQQRIRSKRWRMKKKFDLILKSFAGAITTGLNLSNKSMEQEIRIQKSIQQLLPTNESNGHEVIALLQKELINRNIANHQDLATKEKNSILEQLLMQPTKPEESLEYLTPKRVTKAVTATVDNRNDSQICDKHSILEELLLQSTKPDESLRYLEPNQPPKDVTAVVENRKDSQTYKLDVPFDQRFQQHLNSPSTGGAVCAGVWNSAIVDIIDKPADEEAQKRASHAARMRLVRVMAKQNETPEQAERRRQMARIRAKRARDKRRAARLGLLDDGTSCSSFEHSNDKSLDSNVISLPYSTDNSTSNKPGIRVKKFETTEQAERLGLLKRIQTSRGRENMKFHQSSSCSSDELNPNHVEIGNETNFNESNVKVKQELITEDSQLNLLQPVIEMDPLDLSPRIKEEPPDEVDNNPMVDAVVSDFVAVEMKRIKHANEIDSGEDDESTFKRSFQAERERIEKTIQDENEFLQSDVKPTAEELSAYAAAVNVWNTLESFRGSTSCEEASVVGPLTDRLKYKRALQAERMRRHRMKRKQTETPEEAAKRRENQRLRAERARLKKKALQAGIPVQSDSSEKSKPDEGNIRITAKSTKTSEVEDQVKYRLEQCLEDLNSCTSLDSRDIESSSENKGKSSSNSDEALQAEPSSEIHDEEAEWRKRNQRIRKKRSRGKQRIEDRLNSGLRQKRRETETPEEATACKKKQSLQTRKYRFRLEGAKSAEEIAARKAADRTYFQTETEQKLKSLLEKSVKSGNNNNSTIINV